LFQPVNIESIETFAVCIRRRHDEVTGTAGSPWPLRDASYRYSLAANGTVYSRDFETFLVKLTSTDGVVGWGEGQAPVLPEVLQEIVDLLIAPLLSGRVWGSPDAVRALLYDAMRVRGHFGGFYVDALSAIDCALWDMAGKYSRLPVHRLLSNAPLTTLPIYISGLPGDTFDQQISAFQKFVEDGASAVKIFMTSEPSECLRLISELRKQSDARLLVDALWRFDRESALSFARTLGEYSVDWLESPLPPEDLGAHKALADRSPVKIAIGESYRTLFELSPFFDAKALHILQPDIGRCGISEANRLAEVAKASGVTLAPHISIGLGPQIAAALHCSAAWSNLDSVECNPHTYAIAEQFSATCFRFSTCTADISEDVGLGIVVDEQKLALFSKKTKRTSLIRSEAPINHFGGNC
jgi:D-galactarolactone cycloisomerase